MEGFLEFVKGPLFAATFIFMLLGLARHVFLQAWNIAESVLRLTRGNIRLGKGFKGVLNWLIPTGHVYRQRPFMSATSLVFHASLLLVPLFLVGHIQLWHNALGLWWPGLPMVVADALTIVAIVAAVMLIGFRLINSGTRRMSDPGDYALLVLLTIPFVTGFMIMHPSVNPLSYNAMLLGHLLSAELIFVLLPTTKLTHCVLFPLNHFSSEIYWNMPAGAGEKVARELHGEEARV